MTTIDPVLPKVTAGREQTPVPMTASSPDVQRTDASTAVTLSTSQDHFGTPANDIVYALPAKLVRRSVGNSDNGAETASQGTQLHQSNAEVQRLLQQQPGPPALLPAITPAQFQTMLNTAFGSTGEMIDPDRIHVIQYVNANVVLDDGNAVPERRPTSSLTLNQALQAALANGQAPIYDVTNTGFFRAGGNAVNNSDALVSAMDGVHHVQAFQKILQDCVQRPASHYQQMLKDFWNHADPASVPQNHKAQLAAIYQQQRQIEASLRASDGTLSRAGKRLLDQAYDNASDSAASRQAGVFSMSLGEGGIPFSGLFLVAGSTEEMSQTTSGPVLLVIPGQGLMEFSSVSAYQSVMQRWLADPEQRALLLEHVAHADRPTAGQLSTTATPADSLYYQAITTPVFADRIQSRLDQQQRDIMHVFNSYAPQIPAAGEIIKKIHVRQDFDTDNIDETRLQLLVKNSLRNASSEDKIKWLQELKKFMQLWKNLQRGLPAMRQYLNPGFLNIYAKEELQKQIKTDLGFDTDPDQLIVTTQRYFERRGPIPQPTVIEKRPFSRPLTELALSNAGQLGEKNWNEVSVQDTDGFDVPGMTHDYLTGLVRGLNVGQRYTDLLQEHLLNSAEGNARETKYMQFLTAQLQLDAREARIQGNLSATGMRWVHAALANRPEVVNAKPVQARQLYCGGKLLSRALLFATQRPVMPRNLLNRPDLFTSEELLSSPRLDIPVCSTGTSKVVLYLPDAPDGKRLREFDSREKMREYFDSPAMRTCLLSQIDFEHQAEISVLLKKSLGQYDMTDTAIVGSFSSAYYRGQAAQVIANADIRTTSNDEDDRQARWDNMNLAFDVVGIFLPPIITIPVSLWRAAHSFSHIPATLRRDDTQEAMYLFFDGIGHLGNAVLDSTGLSLKRPKPLRQPGAGIRTTSTADAATQTQSLRSSPLHSHAAPYATTVPLGMTSVQIEGKTYYYWQSTKNTAPYRDLFEADPNHADQLRSAGYGAPDADNVWQKISLRGGGRGQSRLNGNLRNSAGIAPDPDVARQVRSEPSDVSGVDYLTARIRGQSRRLIYNLQENNFSEPSAKAGGNYFPRYNEMIRLSPLFRRTVTDGQREATLKALGIHIKLPLDFSATQAANVTPIPRLIHSVWVGGEIPSEQRSAILTSLQNNALMARSGARPYEMKLYLSNRDSQAYAVNLEHLRTRAPDVPVVVLENTSFYKTFKESKYFRQYETAIDGNGGVATNYASAVDILRYRLLHFEGGLYIDCDDTLTTTPGSVDIKTSANGLALDEPVSNSTLGMDMQYNNSIFGAQKNSLTLDAISEESYLRFSQAQELYTTPRPRRFTLAQQLAASIDENAANEARLSAYMKNVSHVSGPKVFNDVIDLKLPAMRQLRDAIKMKAHVWNFSLSREMQTNIAMWGETLLPLGQISRIGNAHTWTRSR